MRKQPGSVSWVVALVLSALPVSAGPLLRSPGPGDVYAETTVVMTGGAWRVTDPNATATGSPGNSPADYLPNATLVLPGVNLAGAVRSEAVIDVWGGHIGTTGKRFRLNGNAWLTIPELDTTPTSGQCYLHQVSYVLDVPLGHLVAGNNTLQGTSGGQSCYGFNWGQWGWYSFTLRVYYPSNAKVAHPTGSISSPAAGSTVGANPLIQLALTDPSQVSLVDVFASYVGYDEDGDGYFDGYHHDHHRAQSGETTLVPKRHVGRITGPPWQVTWDTSLVQDQPAGSIKLIARIRGTNGIWHVTDEVDGLTLDRPGASVHHYHPRGVAERMWARAAGAQKKSYMTIPEHVDLTKAVSAKLLIRSWNGIDGEAEAGEEHWSKLNNNLLPEYGKNHFYGYDAVDVPVSYLKKGVNTFAVYSESTHHGMEILWPGPGLLVTYAGDVPALCGDDNLDPGEACDDGNLGEGDGCEADCTIGLVDFLKSPESGSVYREYTRIMSVSTKLWRVTDPNARATGSPGNSPADFLPNPELPFTVDDLQGAVRAQAMIDVWGGHIGTSRKEFRLNGHDWLPIPDLVTTPTNAECYLHQFNAAVDVPLDQLVEGTNVLQGNSGPQVCYGFNWGQWGWYTFTLRVFYDPASKIGHPTGSIVSPASGDTLGEHPTITAEVDGDVERVEFIGYYEDYDTDGDGVYEEWRHDYHRERLETVSDVRNHVGTANAPPWSVVWDTTAVPTQKWKHVKLVARILGADGTWYVTDPVVDLSLQREASVRLYKAQDVPESLWVRSGLKKSSNVTIPDGHDFASASAAWLVARTWNGIDGAAEAGEAHWIKVNTWQAPNFGDNHFYSLDSIPVPLDKLRAGSNKVEVYSESTHHGIEMLWPGPALKLRYPVSNGACGDGYLDWAEGCDDGNAADGDGCSALCAAQTCGDGQVDVGEECDDANAEGGDGCDADCVVEACGNGVSQSGEQCDDGNQDDLDACGNDCVANFCGDGAVNNGEGCDDGGTSAGDGCDSGCLTEVCGNGVVQSGEQCDDGNTDDLDGCGNDCAANFCGDGQTNNGEACDDGNRTDDDACRNDCVTPGCGDGRLDDGEACDDGNGNDLDACGNDCLENHCGDGEVANGEECDDGNTVDGDLCSNDCRLPIVCDNAVVNGDFAAGTAPWSYFKDGTGGYSVVGGEARLQITMPGTNVQLYQYGIAINGSTVYRLRVRGRSSAGTDVDVRLQQHGLPYASYGLATTLYLTPQMADFVMIFTTPAGDRTDARLMLQVGNYDVADSQYYFDDFLLERVAECPYCGDALVGLGEACDDGNRADGDDCRGDCRLPACGDGWLDELEACDDGNTTGGDGCDAACSIESCGNGVVQAGEQCDDGNTADGDGCDADCFTEACGNGVAQAGEACDDGNVADGDGCDSACRTEACGNGILQHGEQCDDGNAVEGDGCRSDCTVPLCGDGRLDPGEQCDDGNAVDLDACGNGCAANYCGDGEVNNGEECDDANADDGDGCRTDCTWDPCGATDVDGDNINDVCDPDDDNDGTADGDDCAPLDASAAGLPPEVGVVTLIKSDRTILIWTSLGQGVIYDVVGGSLAGLRADGSAQNATCFVSGTPESQAEDLVADPAPGEGRYYLVRGANVCGVGTFGFGSHGEERLPADACD